MTHSLILNIRTSLLLCVFCLLASRSYAQASDSGPAADPGRPSVSSPAHIPPAGYLQFEQGGLDALTTPGGPDRQFSVVQTTKLALDSHWMVFAQSQPVARSVMGSSASNDAGGLGLGAQVVLRNATDSHPRIPALAVSYEGEAYDGTAPSLDVGSSTRTFLALASGNLFGLQYDTNLVINEQQADAPNTPGHIAPRRAQWGQTLCLTHGLTKRLSVSGEIYRFTQPLTRGNVVANLYAVGYTVRKTLVLDAGFSKGLTSTSTDWQSFAGFTYLLPHRLWRMKHHA